MAQLQAPPILLLAISFLFLCAEGRLVPTPCWQDPNCREDPHPPRQRGELTPAEVVEPNRLVPRPCCEDPNCREDSHSRARDPTSMIESLARDPSSMIEVFEPTRLVPTPLCQDPNCYENPHPLAPDPTSMTEVVEPTTRLLPSHVGKTRIAVKILIPQAA